MDRVLTALLYRRAARAALAAGDFAALGLGGDDAASAGARAAFAAIDVAELEASAALLRRQLVERRHRGTGGLVDWYPRTLAAWRARHPEDVTLDALAAMFLESAHAEAWREGAAADASPPGLCLEEAFFRFAVEHDLGDAASREDEWLTAQLRALALCPEPAFAVPARLFPAPGGGWFVVSEALVLYAAVRGRFLRGAVTPGIAAALRGEESPPEVRAALVALGLR